MDRMNGRSLLIALPIGIFLWMLIVLAFWLRPAHSFGHTINMESSTISIYLDVDEFPRITGAEMKRRLCETRLQSKQTDGARPSSVFAMSAHGVSNYEVYRRGNPNTLFVTFSMNDCYPKEDEYGKKE